MSDIQRYWPDIEGVGVLRAVMRPIPDDMHPDDEYVKYADHVAAVAEAEQRGRDERRIVQGGGLAGYREGYEQGRLAQSAVEMDTAVINQNAAYQKGYEQGKRDAVSAPITDDNTYASVYGHGWTNGQADGYANALADAVAAVEALFPMPDVPQPIRGEQVIAAIKAVGHVESDTQG